MADKTAEILEDYIKKTLTNEISKEKDKDKVSAFLNTLNDLIVNEKELENVICLEFQTISNEIYITRCSKSFCGKGIDCTVNDCRISDFIGYNPDLSEYVFKKMEEKINEIRPGFLQEHSLHDYIKKYLGKDDDLIDLMIINDYVIINEEIQNEEPAKIINDYLFQSLRSMTTKKIEDEAQSDMMKNLVSYAVESNIGFLKYMWNIFEETQSYIKTINPDNPADNSENKNTDNPFYKKINNFSNKYNLSEREIEVLLKILEGYTTKDIGDKLFISPGTARNHIQNIFAKTETHSRIELFNSFNKF